MKERPSFGDPFVRDTHRAEWVCVGLIALVLLVGGSAEWYLQSWTLPEPLVVARVLPLEAAPKDVPPTLETTEAALTSLILFDVSDVSYTTDDVDFVDTNSRFYLSGTSWAC